MQPNIAEFLDFHCEKVAESALGLGPGIQLSFGGGTVFPLILGQHNGPPLYMKRQ